MEIFSDPVRYWITMLVILSIIYLPYYLVQKKKFEKRQQEFEVQQKRQTALLKELDFLADLVDNKQLTAAELDEKSQESFAAIERLNVDGSMTDVFNDMKRFYTDEMQRRI